MANKPLTDEQKRLFNERRRKTCLEKYGDPTYNNVRKGKDTKLLRYGNPNYNNQSKHKETCLERYGVEHHNQTEKLRHQISSKKLTKETQQKYEQTCLNRYGNTNINLVPEIRDKCIKSYISHFGYDNPLKNPDIKAKQLETLRLNHSFNKSNMEERYYNYLVSIYKKEDVVRQYKDKRYPFSCDFYIKSEDKFIECNFHWTHGGKPYDPDDLDCQKQLLEWQEKARTSKYFQNAINTWTIRDVNKLKVAKENNINYKVIYRL